MTEVAAVAIFLLHLEQLLLKYFKLKLYRLVSTLTVFQRIENCQVLVRFTKELKRTITIEWRVFQIGIFNRTISGQI